MIANLPETELRRKLAWAIGVRLGVGAALLTSVALFDSATSGIGSWASFGLIGLLFCVSLGAALSLGHVYRHRWLIDVQLAGDALVVSAFVVVTGGVVSYYSSLAVLPIIAAAMFQFRRGALLVATLTTVLYSGMVAAQYLGAAGLLSGPWLPAGGELVPFSVTRPVIVINVCGFFGVAWLAGSLAESLRRADVRLERASHTIADLQAYNEHVIDSLTSGLVTTDRRGQILTFNRAASTIAGLETRRVIGRPIDEVIPLPPIVVERVAESPAPGGERRPYRAEFAYRSPDGRTIEIGMSVVDLETPGGRTGWLFTFQDVTDIKKLERDAQLRQRLAAVGEMAAAIAHEIRNPLASMSGSIQILRQELPLTTEQAQLMDIVLRESERLNETIRSFLAYARPRRFAITPLDAGRLLQDTAMLLRHSAEVKAGHRVEVDVPAEPVLFEADENQIRQIVWNLATNGLRAMPHGGQLRLAARAMAPAGEVVLEVGDQGVGIPPDELEGIFQPFHGSFKGTGLGLAIVHRIVTDYKGEVAVRSAPGQGTTVSVRLPLLAAVEAA